MRNRRAGQWYRLFAGACALICSLPALPSEPDVACQYKLGPPSLVTWDLYQSAQNLHPLDAASTSELIRPSIIMNMEFMPAGLSDVSLDRPPQSLMREPDGSRILNSNAQQEREPSEYASLWERVRAGFTLPRISSPLVARYRAWYTKHPEHLKRVLERSQRYLYFIVSELEKRNMPNEIALLPIIESAYNPHALSPMRAAGIWQFIPSTGRHYGLQQDLWYDGRRDVVAATRAALDYLQFLHDMFSDWEVALAAYNWGEYAAQRAIAKNAARHMDTRYANLKMPAETRAYLPKLQAVKDLIDNHSAHGLELPHVPNEPYFAATRAEAEIDMVKAAELANVSMEEFKLLNAGYAGPLLIPATERQIVLPVSKIEGFTAKLENYNEPLTTWQKYTLKKGETLQKVARRFSTSISLLREANRFLGRKPVRPGQILMVPIKEPEHALRRRAAVSASMGTLGRPEQNAPDSENAEPTIHLVD
jgi:LysM repeat protein